MRRSLLTSAAFAVSALLAAAAHSEPAPAACALASGLVVAQDQGVVTLVCIGPNEAQGNQLAELLSRILQNRLDPQAVLVKLEEIAPVPRDGVARLLDDAQREAVIRVLSGNPPEQIAIVAHPEAADSGDFAKALAMPLLMVGWRIESNQIRRVAPKPLAEITGVALVVRDRNAAPEKAVRLKAALAAARIVAPLVSDPALPGEATTLWVGRRSTVFGVAEKR